MRHGDKKYFYERFAKEFDKRMNMYDLNKRLRIIFEEMLSEGEVSGRSLLDVGCGTGWFSRRALQSGAYVTSLDVGDNLLDEVGKKCEGIRTGTPGPVYVKGDVCELEFGNDTFDVVIATEVIEHTVNPMKAIQEMYRVLKKDGILVLTVPNKMWHFAVTIGNALRVRPYEGYENWVGWNQLRNSMVRTGFEISDMFGFHVVPFVSRRLYRMIDYCDRYGRLIGPVMLNIAVKGLKT